MKQMNEVNRAKRDRRRQCTEFSLAKLTEEKNTMIKITFWNLYGFHLINDSQGEHYIYLHRDNRMESKLKYFSKSKDKFIITRGMIDNNRFNAYIQFQCNKDTFDIIEKFLLEFILRPINDADIQRNYIKVNVKKSMKTDVAYYKKWLKNHKNGYMPL
uniref:Uncharacterized protein n=1 Tax=Mimivirus LCMiAC01 TaxID=2506608 RepID=A0A481Z1V1_9VIRU|nr:MAG: hypothetical protein LCMiAC01_03540 [Mimivirus LCMiAC01]